MVFQNVITLLMAAAVCWHTVIGCCAHHAHAQTPSGEQPPGEQVHRESLCEHHGVHPGSGGHRHADASASAPQSDASHAHVPHRHSSHDPAGCSQTRCVFAAPNVSGPQPVETLVAGAAGYVGSLVAPALAVAAPVPSARRCGDARGFFLGNAARRHLALSVFLL